MILRIFLGFSLWLLFCKTCLATQQELYYNLHQATNLLEQMARGKCASKKLKVQRYLIAADKALDETVLEKQSVSSSKNLDSLEPELHNIWKFFNGISKNTHLVLESFRFELHSKAERMQLGHLDSWYREVRNCGGG